MGRERRRVGKQGRKRAKVYMERWEGAVAPPCGFGWGTRPSSIANTSTANALVAYPPALWARLPPSRRDLEQADDLQTW